MTDMRLTWDLPGGGWADITVTDNQAEAHIVASFITSAANEFLTAVARLVLGEQQTRVQFEAEPTAFRWIFYREGTDVRIRLLELPDGRQHDSAGTEIWSSRQTVNTLARVVIRCFDQVAYQYGQSGYHDKWREPFPHSELEALRVAWRASRHIEPA